MPYTITAESIIEKNRLSSTGLFLELIEIILSEAGTTLRLVNNNEDIVWNSLTWSRSQFRPGDFTESIDGGIESEDINVSNLQQHGGKTIQGHVEDATIDNLLGDIVNYYLVDSKNLDKGATIGINYEIQNISCNEQFCNFTLGMENFYYRRFPLNVFRRNICRWKVFGGPECRFALSSANDCDRRFITCIGFGNQLRFGGFPGIPRCGTLGNNKVGSGTPWIGGGGSSGGGGSGGFNAVGPPDPIAGPTRSLFAGGETLQDVIDYVTISTLMNAIDFGDLTEGRAELAACSSLARGLFGGGDAGIGDVIDYVTIATLMNALDFGDLTLGRTLLSACSSSTRGLFGGDTFPGDTIDYVTIATLMDALDFGDLTVARNSLAACSSDTRGLFGGGEFGGRINVIDYVTIATTMNAIDFGDLSVIRDLLAACSNNTRGLFAGGLTTGSALEDTIDYVTIATTMNAIDFGDLTIAREDLASSSSNTRGLFAGGITLSGDEDTIDYVTIATLMDALDFGDLTVARRRLSSCSGVG